MRLFIAEKPSMARAIAEGLGIKKKDAGYIECANNDCVTWAFGHLLEQFNPEEYDKVFKQWKEEYLPIVPDVWQIKPKSDSGTKKQLNIIKTLLKKYSTIINAGDPDREGQLLIDEILEYFNNKKPVHRILLSALDPKSVKHALNDIKDNKKFRPLKDEALARSRADWLVGFNLTRAMTISAQRQGLKGVFSIGRVQTPTLALVVERDRLIENFKPVDYFVPKIKIEHPNGIFEGVWLPNENNPDLDPENRLINHKAAQKIVQDLKGKAGQISQAQNQKKKVAPPLPYNLSTLQKEASAKFGFGAKQTLSLAQDLYEKKATTYPRSDCRYLPEEQHSDAKQILSKLGAQGFSDAKNADPSLKSSAWNTKKTEVHQGIIPTGEKAGSLSGDHKKLFSLIANSYIQQFFPAMEYVSQQIITSLGNEMWKSAGKKMIAPGWTVVGKNKSEKDTSLPDVQKHDAVTCIDFEIDSRQTKPPARFTEGSLIEAMASVHKFVTNPQIKALLKESSGIGTDATRANIIETLFSRDYLEKHGKQIQSTKRGRALIDVTPENLTDPGTTAVWEDQLKKIGAGQKDMTGFLSDQISILPKMCEIALNAKFPEKIIGKVHKCPECGSALRRMKSKKNGQWYWVCFEKKRHPGDQVVFLSDQKGAPVRHEEKPCPVAGCDQMMIRLQSKKNKDFYFWKCKNENHPLRFDDNGSPGNEMKSQNQKKRSA
jgi:DNA topoisomerase-3